MKWFKHFSDASEDEVLSAVIDEFGVEGYGVWWLMIEIICKQIDETPRDFVEYSLKRWRKMCGVSTKKFEKIVTFLEKSGKIFTEKSQENNLTYLKIHIPKISQIADEYTKKMLAVKETTAIDTRRIIATRDRFTCQYCNRQIEAESNLHIDHIVPKSRGGKDSFNNLVATCSNCNLKKGDRLPQDVGFNFPIIQAYNRKNALEDLFQIPDLLDKYNNIFNAHLSEAKLSQKVGVKSKQNQDIIKSDSEKKPPRLDKIRLEKIRKDNTTNIDKVMVKYQKKFPEVRKLYGLGGIIRARDYFEGCHIIGWTHESILDAIEKAMVSEPWKIITVDDKKSKAYAKEWEDMVRRRNNERDKV